MNGESGTSSFNSGGGSGGLLYVNASSLIGRGSLTSNGGDGLSGSIGGQSYGMFYIWNISKKYLELINRCVQKFTKLESL